MTDQPERPFDRMARRAIEAYESAGSVHLALRHWGEEEWRPTEPQAGQLLTCSVGLPDDLAAEDLEHLGVDDFGRVLAERENALVLDARHAVTTEVPDLQDLHAAVRRALGQVLGHSTDLGIWLHDDFEGWLLQQPDAREQLVRDDHPLASANEYWGTWRNFIPVFLGHRGVRSNEVWVLGRDAASLRLYPDRVGQSQKIAFVERRDGGRRVLEARLWAEVRRRRDGVLQRVLLKSAV